jgi:HK97 family phage portal protein
MRIFGMSITKAPKYPAGAVGAAAVGTPGQGGYIREPYTGAWQEGKSLTTRDGMMASSVPYSCTDLISSDIAKLRIKYVKLSKGVWLESPAPRYTDIIKQPNAYQTRDQFIKAWVASKLSWGNTYILLTRNSMGAVIAMDVLNPKYVVPLVAPDQSVYYQITMSPLQVAPLEATVVPARDIIHDRGLCPWHPLVGMSPLAACAASVLMATSITNGSAAFFGNQARPSGVLTAPGKISAETAAELKAYWAKNFTGATGAGKIAVMGDDLKYTQMSMSSTDAQLIEQLNFSVADIARCFHVPLHKIGADNMRAAAPSNAVFEAAYYSDCLQSHIEAIECLLEIGLSLPSGQGLRFDLSGLMRMDEAAMITSNAASVGAGIMKPNEARAKQGLEPVPGGDTPYLQQQNYALSALAKRDAAGPPKAPAAPVVQPTDPAADPPADKPKPEPAT